MLSKGSTLRDHSLAVFQAALVVIALAVLFVHHFTAAAAPESNAVWIADQKQLKRVDPAVNQYVQTITLSNAAEAIAFDARNNVLWALANKHLLTFNSTGAPVADYDLTAQTPPADVLKRHETAAASGIFSAQTPPADVLKRLVLDPYDASLWVAGEKTVLHVSAQGQILLKWTSSQNLQAIGLDPDQSLWVLTQNGLYQLSVAGTVLSNLALPNTLIPDPTFLAVDGLGGYLWVAGKKTLIRLDANDLTKPPLTAPLPATVNGANNKLEALLTHPIFGTVWAASTDTLLLYDRDATVVRQVDLTPQALGIPQAMAYEYGSASLWLGGKAALGRYTPNGDYVTKLPADIAISALATGPFAVSPTLTLLAPLDNSVTNNPRPPFRLGLGAECNGAPCASVDAYTQAFTLDATLNGSAIGNLFTLANREALYTPPTRLPEGLNLFSTQAKDVFWHLSNRINSQVTIDTIPPKFLSIAPADGGTLTTATVTVSGKLDDPTASVMLQNAAGTVLNVGNATFSFSVTLAQGLNTFSLTAQDPAGNATQIPYRLSLNAVAVTILSPANGASINAGQTVVSGTFQGPANTGITVNGQVALTQGNQFFASIPLTPGANTLTAQATTPEGASATHAVNVTRGTTAPDPAEVRAEPLSGIAPLTVRFSVSNNSTQAITRIDLDADGNGATDVTTTDPNATLSYTYLTLGIYQPRIIVTQGGTAFTQTLVVGVNDAQQMDQLFTAIWAGMNNALARGDLTAALGYLNESAKRKYQRVFTALLPQMPQIIASYSPLRRVSISENIGEYAINRTINGRNKIFLIYFLKDADGVWRLDAM